MTAWRRGDGRRKSVAIYAFCRDLLWRLALVIVKSGRGARDFVEDAQFIAGVGSRDLTLYHRGKYGVYLSPRSNTAIKGGKFSVVMIQEPLAIQFSSYPHTCCSQTVSRSLESASEHSTLRL
jgi:hypothetical protein